MVTSQSQLTVVCANAGAATRRASENTVSLARVMTSPEKQSSQSIVDSQQRSVNNNGSQPVDRRMPAVTVHCRLLTAVKEILTCDTATRLRVPAGAARRQRPLAHVCQAGCAGDVLALDLAVHGDFELSTLFGDRPDNSYLIIADGTLQWEFAVLVHHAARQRRAHLVDRHRHRDLPCRNRELDAPVAGDVGVSEDEHADE